MAIAAPPGTAGGTGLPGVAAHLSATEVEVRNGGARALSACRLSLDHRISSGVFDLAAGAVRRVSLEDFHVEPNTTPPSEVQFTYLFLVCREGTRRFPAG